MSKRLSLIVLALTTWTTMASAHFADKTVKVFPSVKGQHKISLTIDDGPTPLVTDAILDILKENKVKATFFMLGKNVAKYPEIVKRIVAEGHLIANHTWDHQWLLEKDPTTVPIDPATGKQFVNAKTGQLDMRKAKWDCRKDDKFAYQEIRSTHDVLKPYLPKNQKRLYFRPPGGGWCSRDTKMMNADKDLSKYAGPVYWSFGGSVVFDNPADPERSTLSDAGDEDCWTSYSMSVDRCLEGYRASIDRLNGGVLLNHDVHMESALLLQILIPELIAQGYDFVTLDQLPEMDELAQPPAQK